MTAAKRILDMYKLGRPVSMKEHRQSVQQVEMIGGGEALHG